MIPSAFLKRFHSKPGSIYSTSPWALMFRAVNKNNRHPVPATMDEKAAARSLVRDY